VGVAHHDFWRAAVIGLAAGGRSMTPIAEDGAAVLLADAAVH